MIIFVEFDERSKQHHNILQLKQFFQLAVCKYRLVFFFGSEIIRSHLGPIRKAVYEGGVFFEDSERKRI